MRLKQRAVGLSFACAILALTAFSLSRISADSGWSDRTEVWLTPTIHKRWTQAMLLVR